MIDEKQYPSGCPKCDSTDIERTDIDGSSELYLSWFCPDCEFEWYENYKFVSWEEKF
jgi:predicted Zn-ribbon and HTH transcriptional regulator